MYILYTESTPSQVFHDSNSLQKKNGAKLKQNPWRRTGVHHLQHLTVRSFFEILQAPSLSQSFPIMVFLHSLLCTIYSATNIRMWEAYKAVFLRLQWVKDNFQIFSIPSLFSPQTDQEQDICYMCSFLDMGRMFLRLKLFSSGQVFCFPDCPWRPQLDVQSLQPVWMVSVWITFFHLPLRVCIRFLCVTVFVPVLHGASHHEVISKDAPRRLLLCCCSLHTYTRYTTANAHFCTLVLQVTGSVSASSSAPLINAFIKQQCHHVSTQFVTVSWKH